jgi:hypothetical protein
MRLSMTRLAFGIAAIAFSAPRRQMRRQSHSSRSTSRRSFSTKSTTAPRRASPQVGNVPPGVLYAGRFDSTPKGNGVA